MKKYTINPRIMIMILAVFVFGFAQAQTIDIGSNEYAFRYTLNNNFGMFFNTTSSQYELRNGSASGVFAIDANTGAHNTDVFFNANSDLLIGANRYAFRYGPAPNFGLFFNATDSEYEFRTADASSIFSIEANSGDLQTEGDMHIGVPSGVLAKFTVNAEPGADVVRFRTDGTTRFIVTDDGNTGIGTSVPSNRLTVNGDANFNGSVGVGTTTPAAELHVDGGTALIGASGGSLAKLTVNSAVNQEVFRGRINGSTNFIINGQGNVGIKTGSPTTALDVNGEISMGSGLGDKISLLGDRIGDADNYGFGVESLTLYYKSNGQHAWMTQENVIGGTPKMLLSSGGDLGIGTSSPSDRVHINSDAAQDALRVQVAGSTKLRVHDNGNVSIGSLSQGPANGAYISGNLHVGTIAGATGYKAAINGKLICEEVRVQDSGAWPDYVFADAYELKSLPEIEAYIITNNHLPDIPSAEVVESEGYELARMDAKLLQKIEELTLHLINMKKSNDQLTERIQLLEGATK